MLKYFKPTPQTAEQLKKLYRVLAFTHHPDRGGTTAAMQAVNNEYDALFAKLKDIHTNAQGEQYTQSKPTSEAPEEFKDIINQLINLDGIIIEIIGSFIWLTGETKDHKEILKTLGFKWSPKKLSWYLAPKDYKRKTRKEHTLNDIRDMFGSSTYSPATNKSCLTA